MWTSIKLPRPYPRHPWCCANLNHVAPWSCHRHKDTTHGMFSTQYMDQYQPPRATLQESMVLCKHKLCGTMVIPQTHRHHTWHVHTDLPWLHSKSPWCYANINCIAPWSYHRHIDTTHGMFTQTCHGYSPSVHGVVQT
jgi:hypothetical protein